MPGRHTVQTSEDLNQFGDKAYRYGFNGKEGDFSVKNVTGSSIDFGDRVYDPRIGKWMSIDSKASKYPNLSPYHFTGNNPIKFVDYDGNDYGVKVNHTNKTIIIKATYIAKHKDVANATSSANKWMAQNGRFQYVIGKGKDAVVYDVKFDITVVDASTLPNPNNTTEYAVTQEAIKNDKTGELNTYEETSMGDPSLYGNQGVSEDERGDNKGIYKVVVGHGQQKKRKTGSHEMGHTLGIGHWVKGLMRSGKYRADDEREITTGNVGQILKNANIGQGSESTNDYQKEGQAGTANATVTPSGDQPAGFNTGKVKKAKKKK